MGAVKPEGKKKKKDLEGSGNGLHEHTIPEMARKHLAKISLG
jgi:hypothetical protein